ncbi:MAG: uroporphyrinogen-III synthase [Microthrixaceae bacterium]
MDDLGELFGRSELWARGPKAARAIRSEGFEPTWQAPGARYDDVVERFGERLDGETAIGPVGVQVDGAGAVALCDRLRELGGVVTRVPLYQWSLPTDTSAAEALIRGLLDGEIQAVTFTAKPAVENLFEIAERMGSEGELVQALSNRAVAACVGPVCASAFDEFDSIVPLVPEQHRLGAMVKQLSDHFYRG